MFLVKQDTCSVITSMEESFPIVPQGSMFEGVWRPPASKPKTKEKIQLKLNYGSDRKGRFFPISIAGFI